MHPILFQSSNFTIHTLWVFVAIAVFIGFQVGIKLSIENRLKINFLSQHSFKLTFFTLLISRITFIAFNFSYFINISDFSLDQIWSLFTFWDRGLSFYGGLIGFFSYFYLACKKNDQSFMKWLDTLIPSLLFAVAIANLGTFFDGINYGRETSLPWGVNFENPSIKYTVPIHPTQIYAFIYNVLIGIFLISLSHVKKFQEKHFSGILGLLGISLFSLFRFLEGFARGDDTILLMQSIRLPQVIAAVTFILSSLLLLSRYKIQNKRFLKENIETPEEVNSEVDEKQDKVSTKKEEEVKENKTNELDLEKQKKDSSKKPEDKKKKLKKKSKENKK